MRKIIWGIIIVCALFLMAFALGMCSSLIKHKPFSSGEIALIKVEGGIFTADSVIEDLEDVRKDASIKAVLLRVDSPGGAVGASQEIFEEVKRVDAEKPVIVSMGNVAASGGYYIACGGRKIFANLGTITGSIGVRMEHVNLKDLLSWAKIEHKTLKSGEYKDVGAFDRPMTPEEQKYLEGVLAGLHKQFKMAVAYSRKIPIEKVNDIADGRIYTGEEALELGLIDEIGGLAAATKAAGEAAGIPGEPNVREIGEKEPWWLELLFSGAKNYLKMADRTLALYKM